jgi:F-type H+/Na+-transporting ATPase subunit alpha
VPGEEQVVQIFLGTRGHLDDVPVQDVQRFVAEFLDNIRRHHKDILDTIRETKQFSEDTEKQLVAAVKEFKRQFTTEAGAALGTEAEAESMEAEEVEHESVQVDKPAPKK